MIQMGNGIDKQMNRVVEAHIANLVLLVALNKNVFFASFSVFSISKYDKQRCHDMTKTGALLIISDIMEAKTSSSQVIIITKY